MNARQPSFGGQASLEWLAAAAILMVSVSMLYSTAAPQISRLESQCSGSASHSSLAVSSFYVQSRAFVHSDSTPQPTQFVPNNNLLCAVPNVCIPMPLPMHTAAGALRYPNAIESEPQ